MSEKKKHKIMLGIEVVLLCMIVAILGTNAASSNPPSNGVSYGKNNQTTVEGALNDLYTKANYGNASAAQILKDKTALVGGKQVKGTMPLKDGSSQATKVSANASNVYMVFPYGYYPAENHFSTANSSEVYASNANVASAIGLTEGKLLKGQTVLGITGTGETTCSTCESQGYYKIKKFEEVKATVDSYQTFNGSWKRLSDHTVTSNNSVGGVSKFTISLKDDLGISPTQIVDYTIIFTCNDNFRFSRGYDKNSETAMYWYPEGGRLVVTKEGNNQFGLFGNNTLNSTLHSMAAYVSGSNIGVEFSTTRFTDKNGTTNSAFETKCTEFYLSGTIVYK